MDPLCHVGRQLEALPEGTMEDVIRSLDMMWGGACTGDTISSIDRGLLTLQKDRMAWLVGLKLLLDPTLSEDYKVFGGQMIFSKVKSDITRLDSPMHASQELITFSMNILTTLADVLYLHSDVGIHTQRALHRVCESIALLCYELSPHKFILTREWMKSYFSASPILLWCGLTIWVMFQSHHDYSGKMLEVMPVINENLPDELLHLVLNDTTLPSCVPWRAVEVLRKFVMLSTRHLKNPVISQLLGTTPSRIWSLQSAIKYCIETSNYLSDTIPEFLGTMMELIQPYATKSLISPIVTKYNDQLVSAELNKGLSLWSKESLPSSLPIVESLSGPLIQSWVDDCEQVHMKDLTIATLSGYFTALQKIVSIAEKIPKRDEFLTGEVDDFNPSHQLNSERVETDSVQELLVQLGGASDDAHLDLVLYAISQGGWQSSLETLYASDGHLFVLLHAIPEDLPDSVLTGLQRVLVASLYQFSSLSASFANDGLNAIYENVNDNIRSLVRGLNPAEGSDELPLVLQLGLYHFYNSTLAGRLVFNAAKTLSPSTLDVVLDLSEAEAYDLKVEATQILILKILQSDDRLHRFRLQAMVVSNGSIVHSLPSPLASLIQGTLGSIESISSNDDYRSIIGHFATIMPIFEACIIDDDFTGEALESIRGARASLCEQFHCMALDKLQTHPRPVRRVLASLYITYLINKANWGDSSCVRNVMTGSSFWGTLINFVINELMTDASTDVGSDLSLLASCLPEINRGMISGAIGPLGSATLDLLKSKFTFLLMTIESDSADKFTPALYHSIMTCLLGINGILGTLLGQQTGGTDLSLADYMTTILSKLEHHAQVAIETGNVFNIEISMLCGALLIGAGTSSSLANTSDEWIVMILPKFRTLITMIVGHYRQVPTDSVMGFIRIPIPFWMYFDVSRSNEQFIARITSVKRLLSSEPFFSSTKVGEDRGATSYMSSPLHLRLNVTQMIMAKYSLLLLQDTMSLWRFQRHPTIIYDELSLSLVHSMMTNDICDARMPLSLFASILTSVPSAHRLTCLQSWISGQSGDPLGSGDDTSAIKLIARRIATEAQRLLKVLKNDSSHVATGTRSLPIDSNTIIEHFRAMSGKQYHDYIRTGNWHAILSFIMTHVSVTNPPRSLAKEMSDIQTTMRSKCANSSMLHQVMLDSWLIFQAVHELRTHYPTVLRHTALDPVHHALFELSIELLLSKGLFVVPISATPGIQLHHHVDNERKKMAPELLSCILSYHSFVGSCTGKREAQVLRDLVETHAGQVIFGLMGVIGGTLSVRNSGTAWHRTIGKLSSVINLYLTSPDLTPSHLTTTIQRLRDYLPQSEQLAHVSGSTGSLTPFEDLNQCLRVYHNMDYCFGIEWLVNQSVSMDSNGNTSGVLEILLAGLEHYRGPQINALVRDVWRALSNNEVDEDTWREHHSRVVELIALSPKRMMPVEVIDLD